MPQAVGSPRHTAAMVAVCGGKEGGLSKFLLELVAGQVIIAHLVYRFTKLFGDVPGHGKRTAQDFKGIQAKAIGLILDKHIL